MWVSVQLNVFWRGDWKPFDTHACPCSPSLSLFSTSIQLLDGEGLRPTISNNEGRSLGSKGICYRSQVINVLPLLWGGGWWEMRGRGWRLITTLCDGKVMLFAIYMGTHIYLLGWILILKRAVRLKVPCILYAHLMKHVYSETQTDGKCSTHFYPKWHSTDDICLKYYCS